ncbi:DUF3237 domain-containing protein [Agromyces aurantiacus]|uniref:UPF0311 protein ACFPER_08580 n=1 Tax=Agromyces aurantiacus TaxID=165814 RepID=A0ABV9R5T4_9MICO|nr:DUF3237 domain-containing protein [Agromyces aurantiacus]MBM7503524.1 hypothetical protein [Agromyces aurantiacus]
MTHAPTVPALEHAFDVVVRLGPLADHGRTRAGHRRIIPILGGQVSNGLDAELLPGGADWQLVRDDGAIEVDGRYSARTPGGDLLYLQVRGLRTGPPEVLAGLLRGDDIPPDRYYFRTVITIETDAAALAHLEHAVFIASCVRDADAVRYAAYRVT